VRDWPLFVKPEGSGCGPGATGRSRLGRGDSAPGLPVAERARHDRQASTTQSAGSPALRVRASERPRNIGEPSKERAFALEMVQQPVMDRRHTMLPKRDVAVLVAEVRLRGRQVAS
jgi:hypothetical protein